MLYSDSKIKFPYNLFLVNSIIVRTFSSTEKTVDDLIETLKERLARVDTKGDFSKEELKTIFIYKKRLGYILKMLEYEADLKDLREIDTSSMSHQEKSKILESFEKTRPTLKEDNIIINEIDDISEDGKKYKAGQKEFKMLREFDIIILQLVNEKFNLKLNKMFKLLKLSELDSQVKNFIKELRELFNVVLRMDALVFEAEVPRHLFEEYSMQNIKLKNKLQEIGKAQDDFLKIYKKYIERCDAERKAELKAQGPVVRITRMTQKDIDQKVYRKIISEAKSEEEINIALKDELQRLKLEKLSELKHNGGIFNDPDADPKPEPESP